MTVNIRDYSRDGAARGWGAGWPSCTGAAGNLVTITADRSGARLSVHRRIAVLVDLLVDWTEGQGYLGKPAQCGAYNCRPIGGTRTPSNHSWGLAVDWNWQDNPFTTTGKRTMPDWMPRRWNRYGFAWGGDYTGAKKDFMHLEFMGTPADADEMTALARAELGGAPTPAGDDGMAWDTSLPDYYTANANDRLPAGELLAWATTHAANARDAAREASSRVLQLENKVDALMQRMVSGGTAANSGSLSDADVQRVASAILTLLTHKPA